ncbi:MAG: glycoside hydrolase family 3 C-terminal domain-containing protein [Candidatus Eremiobacteraeota bacterium]|nr:glycoside hydrolase family 3 C-terminal domain-containing protein [Candidatus Eremiobacteraeota bacterium]MCW5867189.1 glycoside hydrolase family 3 C-terminal domain-containing protein [Candidatus Eremiobacteraeota bacterium]
MTLEEKLGQIQQFSDFGFSTGPSAAADNEKQKERIRKGGVGSILNCVGAKWTNELQREAVEKSRLKIPILFGFDVIHGHRTTFPTPLGEAASFDPQGCEETAAVAAKESRAQGVRWTFAPMVDIARDARWGRIVEGAGEDTYLGSRLATSRVQGFQRGGKYAACAKHWVAYGAAEAGRDYNTVDVSERTLREVYFPPFKATVDAGVMTFMTSFNETAGLPSTANRFILTDVLRKEWGFRGFVVSDYEAVDELKHHGLAADGAEAGLDSINAGLDMEMVSQHISQNGPALVKSGKLKIATVDEAVRRILRVKKQLGLWEDPYTDETSEQSVLKDPAHRALARSSAARSLVLLKNEKNVLPLQSPKNILVVGPLGDNGEDLLGPWHGDGRKEEVVTLLQGLKNKYPGATVIYQKGCDFKGPVETLNLAAAEVVIVAVGEAETMSGEAKSRSMIGLPGEQEALVKQVHNSGKPYVVTLFNGRPLALGWVAENCPTLLECWFPGSEGGNAVADVLSGDVNPGAKLPVSFPRNVGQCPIYYNHKNTGRPAELRDSYVSTYQDVPNSPQYSFGYGLSYTTFKIDGVTVAPDHTVSATVTNTGSREGDEVVQLYIRDKVSSVTRPVRELRGFQRVTLKPGASQTVKFPLGDRELGFYDRAMRWVVEPGEFEVYVGNSSEAPKATSFFIR